MTYNLKTVSESANKKIGKNVACTYRAGSLDNFGTCPSTCSLLPAKSINFGSEKIDNAYLDIIQNTVPPSGIAWTYSHFDFTSFVRQSNDKCVINYSADNLENAKRGLKSGFPTTFHVSEDEKEKYHKQKEFVICPEQLSNIEGKEKFTCSSCGNGRPLCARADRDYIIVFLEHGQKSKECYGNGFRTRLQWSNTRTNKSGKNIKNLKNLKNWILSLKKDKFLRHHIVGDLGKDKKTIPIMPA